MTASAIGKQYFNKRMRLIVFERWTGLLAVALLGIYGCAQLYAFVLSRAALYTINAYLADSSTKAQGAGAGDIQNGTDYTLWAKARIRAYRAVAKLDLDPPIAVLRIPRLRLTAPVFEGTDPAALNRGLGRIAGTGALGVGANLAIAGHRDGFFRVLKDIEPGDLIQVRTRSSQEIYVVDSTRVVDRRDLSVLRPTPSPTLMLVTCYPFYFVGDAPSRFVVRAVLRQKLP